MIVKKLIIVTGASSGIGRALAYNLASNGHPLLAIGRNEIALQKLKNSNPNLIDVITADIATETGRDKVLNAVAGVESIYALVNNAAIMSPSGFLKDISLQNWRYQMAVNVEAPLFLTTMLLPKLHFGKVLNLTIYSSFSVTIGLGAYGISKAALNMMTRYFQDEFEKYNISVTGVLPGLVDTDIQKQLPYSPDIYIKSKIDELRQAGKLLSTIEVASFLTWLLLETTPEQFSSRTWDIKNDWAILREKEQ